MKQKQIIAHELLSTKSALINVDFKSGQTFIGTGELEMNYFPRLVFELDQTQSKTPFIVKWKLLSWINELPTGEEQYRLKIELITTMPLVCQRCLDDYEQSLEVFSQFILLSSEQEIDDFPIENDDEDALLISKEFNVLELFEDELLLAIPIVPKHDEKDCQQQLSIFSDMDIDLSNKNNDLVNPSTGKPNPFLQLKKLKMN